MNERKLSESKRFSVVRRAQSFTHAGRGLLVFMKSTHNAWVHTFLLACAIALGFYFNITPTEWTLLVLTGGIVFAAEAFNTAIEIDIDLTSPEEHPYARDTKDVAAGAVLLTAITAVLVGGIIFIPYIFNT